MTREPGDLPEHVILPACGARASGRSSAVVTGELSSGWGRPPMPIVLPIFASAETSRVRARMVGPIMAISVFALSTIFAANAQAAEAGASQPWGQLPLKAPARISAFDWTGFYVGGHVGYARGNARVKVVDDDLDSFK